MLWGTSHQNLSEMEQIEHSLCDFPVKCVGAVSPKMGWCIPFWTMVLSLWWWRQGCRTFPEALLSHFLLRTWFCFLLTARGSPSFVHPWDMECHSPKGRQPLGMSPEERASGIRLCSGMEYKLFPLSVTPSGTLNTHPISFIGEEKTCKVS